MIKLLKYLNKKQWFFVFICVMFVVLQVYLELTLPDYMSEITKLVQTPGSKMTDILLNGAYMLCFAIGSALCAVVIGYFASKVSAGLSKKLRFLLFEKVENFSNAEINKFSTSSLITRSTNDVNQIQSLISMGLHVMVKAPIMAVWAICKILNKSWQWSMATFVAVLFLFVVILVIVILAIPKFKRIQTLTDNLNNVTRENLTGVRVVRAFNAEQYEQNKFSKVNSDITKNGIFINTVMSIIDPSMSFVMSALPLSIYWIGAYLMSKANRFNQLVIFSDMVVFSSYAISVVMSFVMLVMIFIMLPRALVSAKRINEVLQTTNLITDGKIELDSVNKDSENIIEFNNVGFKYPDAEDYVLKNINFKVKKGQTVAFIGSTGSGKSTLINLVPRLYDTTEGEILICGNNVKDYKLNTLNSLVGYIPQKATLFTGTIKSNVLMGNVNGEKPKDDDLLKALDISQSNFVNTLDDKENHEIVQGGKNVSGGQKQRIAIARALARKPEILIFDDSFSALDYKTDKMLRKALKDNLKDTTVLIVAQRIGTIKDADKIIVLNEGEIVGQGTHKQLLENCSVYKEIALSQLNEEELKNA